ncbi:hypothetical protein [Arthrobacter pityocampae]|uniref:hypothetical protein n=1 Tax=Arthrobacter pityocampae TaxID=547334 RepID=UPI0037358E6F
MRFTRDEDVRDFHEATKGRYQGIHEALTEWRLALMIARIYAWGAIVWVANRIRPEGRP